MVRDDFLSGSYRPRYLVVSRYIAEPVATPVQLELDIIFYVFVIIENKLTNSTGMDVAIHPSSVSASAPADATQVYSRKWRIGGVLSLDLSPALLDVEARSKTKLFPLRPPGGQGCPIPLNRSPNV